MIKKTKQCTKCKKIKSTDAFYLNAHYFRRQCKKCCLDHASKYYIKNRVRIIKRGSLQCKRKIKAEPWYAYFKGVRGRCSRTGEYGKRGIKLLMTPEDFKTLWFKNKAYLLKRPSIDRIDSKKDYKVTNCRFIELSINIARARLVPAIKLLRLHNKESLNEAIQILENWCG